MKKIYQEPIIEVIEFKEDILTFSNEGDVDFSELQ